MSVVAVKVYKDKIEIASDSIRVTGYTQEKDKLAKLWEVNGMVLGAVGLCEESAMFKIFMSTRKPREASEDAVADYMAEFIEWYRKKDDKLNKLQNSYFLVTDRTVFLIDNFYIRKIDDYYAIGAGMDYALTALYLSRSVEESVAVACELSIYCEKPINKILIEK